MRKFLLIIFFVLGGITLQAQELIVNVQVISNQVANVDKKVFETLKQNITEFMNNTKWTNDVFKNNEKIEVTLLINIQKAISQTEFDATIQVESVRPVYKSGYTTTLLNYNDKDFHFKYVENQPFEFNENTFTNNLTSTLAFYAYIIIGLDYDSFSLSGGMPYFQKAQAVVNNAGNSSDKGWKAFDDNKNRYWLAENLLNPAYKPMRECFYKYHIKGLDVMYSDVESGRKAIYQSLELIQTLYKSFPTLFIMQLFFNAKSVELINIYSQATAEEKNKTVQLLSVIDPANSSKYQKILTAK